MTSVETWVKAMKFNFLLNCELGSWVIRKDKIINDAIIPTAEIIQVNWVELIANSFVNWFGSVSTKSAQ